ncbi:MAG TPA: hypothetical protein VEW04_08775 [Allosphingosinicella sp.]|nr:hypothetical protein [Allosphingosinicella sp.]
MLKLMAAAALLSAPAANPPGAPRCLTRAEVGDLTLVGAAILVEGVRSACRTHLPETAFLSSPAGAEFAGRMRAEGQSHLEPAMNGITRMAGETPNAGLAMVRTVVRGLMAEGSGTEFAQYADAQLCRDSNEILEIASTLTPDQMARFVGAFASIADRLARMAPPRMPAPATPDDEALRPRPTAFAAPAVPSVPPRVVIEPPSRPPLQPFLCPQPQ